MEPTEQTRRAVQWEKLLRSKLAAIRDEAMELSAILEFSKAVDHAPSDGIYDFAQRTVRHAEEIMTNSQGELSLPEEEG